MAHDGLPIQVACRVLAVSESGYYAWRSRAPSRRAIRHLWLTGLIQEVHRASRGTYGARRVQAELTIGHRVPVGHQAVEILMRRAGLKGVPGTRRRSTRQTPTASDLSIIYTSSRCGPQKFIAIAVNRWLDEHLYLDRTQ